MHTIHLTLLFAGLCALLQCGLTASVILRRVQTGVRLLDGGDMPLVRRIRAHANFAETVPIALLLMALLELRGLAPFWLYCLGLALLAGRVLHAGSMLADGPPWVRLAGMVLTLGAISLSGALCIGLFFWQSAFAIFLVAA
jgi:uncharacterized protein